MIETWGFYLFPAHNSWEPTAVTPESLQETFDYYVDLWTRCEQWGFDGLAFAEHHFHPISLSPSPHLLVASVAARTERLKFAIMGSVLSLHGDGRRHAEEVGMLNYLTRGRFEPGIAPGAGTHESELAGIDPAEIRARYYSGAEVLAKALAGPRVTHQNAFCNLDNVQITPPPHLKPGQSVWVTAMSPDSAAWTAERGYKMVTSWTPTPVAAALAERYRAAADAAGRKADPSMLGIRRRVFVADTDAQAQDLYASSPDLVVTMAGQAFETPDPMIIKMMTHPDDIIVGSPETVAERLIEQCRAGGYGVVMALSDNSQFPRHALTRSHELIGTRVAPLLKAADVGPRAPAS